MSKPWFSPKRYGYGAGLPCSWEGWALLAGLLAAIPLTRMAVDALAPAAFAPTIWLAAVTGLIVVFAVIARARTDGGWRWRNGNN
jgi:hypothetical protein